jgi:predicted DNA-binding transcriptional regulator YafY
MRVYRISRVLDARISAGTFERDPGFDLAAFWQSWCAGVKENRPACPVTARVAPEFVPWLPHYFGDAGRDLVAAAGTPDAKGWITVPLPFETLEDARERILGFGGAVEVLEPRALRNSVLDFALQTVSLYPD